MTMTLATLYYDGDGGFYDYCPPVCIRLLRGSCGEAVKELWKSCERAVKELRQGCEETRKAVMSKHYELNQELKLPKRDIGRSLPELKLSG